MHRSGELEPVGQAIGITGDVVGIEVEILMDVVVVVPVGMMVVVPLGVILVVGLRPLDAGIHTAGAAGLRQVFLGLYESLVDRIGGGIGGIGPIQPVAVRIIERFIDVGRDNRGRFDTSADHVERRMHAGENTIVAEIGGTDQHTLILLGHQEGETERLIISKVGVTADEGAVPIW